MKTVYEIMINNLPWKIERSDKRMTRRPAFRETPEDSKSSSYWFLLFASPTITFYIFSSHSLVCRD